MTRIISCSHTIDQVKDRSKTVTRRKGWKFLKAGDRLTIVEKAMGLRKGEHPVKLADVEVVSVSREEVWQITQEDVCKEGFPGMTPESFRVFFCETFGVPYNCEVTRIEWRYLDE